MRCKMNLEPCKLCGTRKRRFLVPVMVICVPCNQFKALFLNKFKLKHRAQEDFYSYVRSTDLLRTNELMNWKKVRQ